MIKDLNINTIDILYKTRIASKLPSVSNNVYLVDAKYVVRIPPITNHIIYNYKDEESVIRHYKSPVETLFFDENTGIKITKYINSNHASILEIKEIVRELKRFHSLKNNSLPMYDFKKKFNVYHKLVSNKFDDKPHFKKYIDNIVVEDDEIVFAHNDLLFSNILCDERKNIIFIDFEFSGFNSLYFDLASIIEENNLEDDANLYNEIIMEYFGSIDQLKILKLKSFVEMLSYYWYIWALALCSITKDEEKKKQYYEIAQLKLEKLDRRKQ